jgi:hypothetical protein
MIRVFQISGCVALIAICLGSVAAFLQAHHGYPDVVYYERVTVAGPALQPPVEQVDIWVDPLRNVERRVSADNASPNTTLIDQQGRRIRDYLEGAIVSQQSLSPDEAGAELRDWRQLLHGGFRALANYRLAYAAGPITHVIVDGHDALRFDTARHDGQTQRLTVWIDAHTHDPLQLQVQTAYYTYIQRVDTYRRIEPGTLPSGFFDAPRPTTSYWDRTLQWVRDKLGRQHAP